MCTELQCFWSGIANGMSSDAAVAAGMSVFVDARWFRKARGMPPAMFRSSVKPLSERSIVCRAGRDRPSSRPTRFDARDRSPPWSIGFDDLSRATAQHRHAKRRPGVSGDNASMARRAIRPASEGLKACTEPGSARLCRGKARRYPRSSGQGRSSWSSCSMARASAWSVEISTMG